MALPNFEASLAFEMLNFMGEDAPDGVAAVREKRAPRLPVGAGRLTAAHRAESIAWTSR